MNLIKIIQNISPKEPEALSCSNIQERQIQQSQQQVIKALKEEILRLQVDSQESKNYAKRLQKQLQKCQEQNQMLKQKIKVITQNNQSLLHTFQVFQRQFVKRNKRQSLPLANDISNQLQGPFHLQIVRTVKSTIQNTFIEPLKIKEKSQFSKLYSYFFQQNSVQQEEVELYNQLVQSGKSIRTSKLKSLGKKNYFNERFRHIFWFNAIQNKLKLTEKYYSLIQSCLQQNIQNRPPKTSIIDLDIRRMDFRIQDDKAASLKIELKKLLELFQLYRPDMGYVQGMSYFGWMFIIRMSPINSFISFSNIILTDPFVSALYSFQEEKIKKIVNFFQECLADKRPKLYKYTQLMGIDSELFIIEWAYTFYTRAFSLKIVSKIWDLWLSEGFNVFFKVAMAIFQMLEDDLLQVEQSDKYVQVLRNSTFKLEQNQFLKTLSKQKLFQDLKLD